MNEVGGKIEGSEIVSKQGRKEGRKEGRNDGRTGS